VLTSITTTAAAKTARIDAEASFSGGGSGGSGKMTAEGAIDFATGDFQMTVYVDGPLGSALNDGFEMRNVDGVAYMRMPSGLPGFSLPDGKHWIAFDVPSGRNSFTSPFALGTQSDPTKALAYLETVSSDVREVGSESIRGVDTTHYMATLDLAKAIDEQNKDVPSGLRDSMKELAGLFGSVPANVWIDNDGRLRRLSLQLDLSEMFRGLAPNESADADHFVITETFDLYDFGTPVHVEAPPADQVARVPSLGDLGAGGGDSSQGA